MALDVLKLREERSNEAKKARALLDKADKENRDLSAEESQEYDGLMKRVDDLEVKITRLEKMLEVEESLEGEAGGDGGAGDGEPGARSQRSRDPQKFDANGRPITRGQGGNESRDEAAKKERRAAFNRYLVGGQHAITDSEFRSLQADKGDEGGFLLPGEQFVDELLQELTQLAPVRELFTVHRLDEADSLGCPTIDAPPSNPTWTSEIGPITADTAMRFGKRVLTAHPLRKLVKISETLLRKSKGRAEGIVRSALATIFSAVQEAAYMTGDGNAKPLGMFVPSSLGISTARDFTTDMTTTTITGDALIGAKGELKGAYQDSPTTRWIFHRKAVTQIRKIKGSDGHYIWQPGLQLGQPDTVLNVPVVKSEYAPSTFTAGQYVGLIGDLKYYWVVEALDFVLKRLAELFALTNEVGFVGLYEGDGMPVLEEAFVRLKTANS